MPTYRYQSNSLNLTQLQSQVPGAPTIGSTGPSIYVDVTVGAGSLADLSEYMTSIGYSFVSTNPTTTPAQQSSAAQVVNQRTTAAATSLTAADDVLFCNTSGGSFNVTLPDPTTTQKTFTIKDVAGTAEANPISLVRFAAEKIENLAATRLMRNNFGVWKITSDGTNWWLT